MDLQTTRGVRLNAQPSDCMYKGRGGDGMWAAVARVQSLGEEAMSLNVTVGMVWYMKMVAALFSPLRLGFIRCDAWTGQRHDLIY